MICILYDLNGAASFKFPVGPTCRNVASVLIIRTRCNRFAKDIFDLSLRDLRR